MLGGRRLEQVNKYKYLGRVITDNGQCDTEIKRRIEITRANFIKMKHLLTSKRLKFNTRIRLMQCYILSTFLYAAETWTINKNMWKNIEALEMWILRKMLKVSYTEHQTNEEILRKAAYKRSLKDGIIKRKNQYFGHILRQGGLQKFLLEAKLDRKRGRGRPGTNWITGITESLGMGYTQCSRFTADREMFRHICHQKI